MFDIGFWELAVIGVVALIILGPERLPGAARTAGLWIGKARRMFADVKADIDKELKASEVAGLRDIGEEIKKAGEGWKSSVDSVTNAADTGGITESLQQDLNNALMGKPEQAEVDAEEHADDAEATDKPKTESAESTE